MLLCYVLLCMGFDIVCLCWCAIMKLVFLCVSVFVFIDHLLFVLFSVDLVSYVTRFQWDRAKYPTAVTLKSLTEIISRVKLHLA